MSRYAPGSPVRREHLTSIAMVNGNEQHISRVIVDGKLMEWVGFGWIEIDEDIPRVNDGIVPEVGF